MTWSTPESFFFPPGGFLRGDSCILKPRSHTNGLIICVCSNPLPLWHSSFSFSSARQTQTLLLSVGSVCRKGTSNCFIRRQGKEKVTKSLSIILLHLNNCSKDTGGCPGACSGRAYKQWGCTWGHHLPCRNFATGKNDGLAKSLSSTLQWKAGTLPAHCPHAWTVVTAGACKPYCLKETAHAAKALVLHVTDTSSDLTLGPAQERSFLSPNGTQGTPPLPSWETSGTFWKTSSPVTGTISIWT